MRKGGELGRIHLMPALPIVIKIDPPLLEPVRHRRGPGSLLEGGVGYVYRPDTPDAPLEQVDYCRAAGLILDQNVGQHFPFLIAPGLLLDYRLQ